MIGNFEGALALVADPTTILVMVLAALFGLVIGSLPGMTATLAAALLVPFSNMMRPVARLSPLINEMVRRTSVRDASPYPRAAKCHAADSAAVGNEKGRFQFVGIALFMGWS